MDQLNDSDDNDLDSLLQQGASVPASTAFRQTLLVQTTSAIRTRRRFRQLAAVVAMAACYLAGLGTMYFLTARQTDAGGVQFTRQHTEPIVEPIPDVPSAPEQAPIAATEADLPAPVLERLAEFVGDDEYRKFYRRAGDRYLTEAGDVAAALRCYRRSLDASPPEELTIQNDDNWLVMAIKQARLEELKHVQNGS